MSGDVKYEAERLKVGDWRWQEALVLGPGEVMDELLTLSEAILGARTGYNEVNRELQQVRERLETLEKGCIQARVEEDEAWKGKEGYESKIAGKNAEVRARREHLYLDGVPEIQGLRQQEWELMRRVEETQAAYQALVDRQKNLHSYARMYEATVRLLATVRAEEPYREHLYFVMSKKLPYRYGVSSPEEAEAIREQAKVLGGEEIDEGEYGVLWDRIREEQQTEAEQPPVEVPSEESLANLGFLEEDVGDIQDAVKRYKDEERPEPVL